MFLNLFSAKIVFYASIFVIFNPGKVRGRLFCSRSAFFWFSKEVRPKVREANPNFSVGEIAKELGRRWSEATPELKSK